MLSEYLAKIYLAILRWGETVPSSRTFSEGVEGCDKILQLDHPINQNGHPLQYIQKVQYTIPTVWKKSKLNSQLLNWYKLSRVLSFVRRDKQLNFCEY